MHTSWADIIQYLNETYPEVGGVIGFAGVAIVLVVLIGIDLRLTWERRRPRSDARRLQSGDSTADTEGTDRVL